MVRWRPAHQASWRAALVWGQAGCPWVHPCPWPLLQRCLSPEPLHPHGFSHCLPPSLTSHLSQASPPVTPPPQCWALHLNVPGSFPSALLDLTDSRPVFLSGRTVASLIALPDSSLVPDAHLPGASCAHLFLLPTVLVPSQVEPLLLPDMVPRLPGSLQL